MAASLLVIVVGLTLPTADATKVDSEDASLLLYDQAARGSVERGLSYLLRNQRPDGSYGSGQYAGNIAVTSLAGLAMMANGSAPGRGQYGAAVEKATEYVLDNTSKSGFVCVQRATSHGPMYDHGFGTLFLAEVYGMTRRADIREKLKKSIQLIIQTQNADGGWRYQPQQTSDADLSVTVCQIMALRAARNAGISVPKSTADRCIDYVKRSQNADGGFRYMISPGSSDFPRSAAGVVALYSAGVYNRDEHPELMRGLNYLKTFQPGMRRWRENHYHYGQYYAIQAMYHAGDDYWLTWYPPIKEEFLRNQRPDGSWTDSVCSEYATAMACIVLQMPHNFLPIFQR